MDHSKHTTNVKTEANVMGSPFGGAEPARANEEEKTEASAAAPPGRKILVVYHRADFDGLFCWQIAKLFLGEMAEYVGWDYGDAKLVFPSDKTVYVLDLSPECFETATISFADMIWIDHHKSAIEKWPGNSIKGYRIDGVAACRLAWQWFTRSVSCESLPCKFDYVDRKVEEPYAVRLAGEYDIWDKRDPNAEAFQFGLRLKELTDWDWAQMLDMTIEDSLTHMQHSQIYSNGLLQNGFLLQRYQQETDAGVVKFRSFLVEFEGLKFLALNTARCNSLTFAVRDVPETGHEALMGFYWNGSAWSISLYHAKHRTDLDLSEIAKKFGGGGHRGACGFRISGKNTVTKLPFNRASDAKAVPSAAGPTEVGLALLEKAVASPGAVMIAEERRRQQMPPELGGEGWTAEHDNNHPNGELSMAATCYAAQGNCQVRGQKRDLSVPDLWPWDGEYWKPSDDLIVNLTKGGALIAAEIDRLKRKA